ncbi:MAG: hypothetical protein WD035_10285, partial [Balneolaceae bacterium]
MKIKSIVLCVLSGILVFACSKQRGPTIMSGNMTLIYNDSLYTKIEFTDAGEPLMTNFQPSEILRTDDQVVSDFILQDYQTESFTDERGSGQRLMIDGLANGDGFSIEKRVTATAYDHVPGFITTRVTYINHGDQEVSLDGWENNRYVIQALSSNEHEEEFWSFQSGSYSNRPDWVLPVGEGFQQQNFLGMNASDYGGGTPVVDVWRPDAGLAVGHLEIEPQLISLPVQSADLNMGVQIAVQFDADSVSQAKFPHSIMPGESMSTFETFLTAHTGDYYTSLTNYRNIMTQSGMEVSTAPE